MISLFLNTASSSLHVALVEDGVVKDEIFEVLIEKQGLSKVALVRLKELLDRNELVPDDVDDIYVVEGPGSFTGLRVGVTIAKTYAWGLNKVLHAVSNLFVMASSIVGYDYVVPVIDARRGYVFAGIYDKKYNSYLNDQYISIEDLKSILNDLDGNYVIVSATEVLGLDVKIYEPNLNNTWKYLKSDVVNCFTFEPNYLKKTEAEENLKNDN